jgi:hypothetical protein
MRRDIQFQIGIGVRSGKDGWSVIECNGISQRYAAPYNFPHRNERILTATKGAQVSEATPISFHYTRNFRPDQSLIVEDDLIACDLDVAPDAFRKELINVCTLTTDLNTVPKSLFTRLTTTKGVEFDNLDFTLDMRIESAGLMFELRVDGVRYGGVSAKFH